MLPASSRRGMTAWLLPVLLLTGSALFSSGLALAPKAGDPVAVLFPPWWSGAEAASASAAARSDIVRMGAWRTVLIVRSDTPGLARRLVRAGAWLILDPIAAFGCRDGRGGGE